MNRNLKRAARAIRLAAGADGLCYESLFGSIGPVLPGTAPIGSCPAGLPIGYSTYTPQTLGESR